MNASANADKPVCFGMKWDPKAPECRGGTDPGYIDPQTGNNIRPACMFFGACGVQTQGSRFEAARRNPGTPPQQGLIHPQALVRPEPLKQYQQYQPAQPPQVNQHLRSMYQPQPTPQSPTYALSQYSTPMPTTAPSQMMVPIQQEHFHPASYQPLPVHYGIPGYLSVQETREDGEGIVGYASRSIFRSMLKGGAHGLAHLIDVTPFRRSKK